MERMKAPTTKQLLPCCVIPQSPVYNLIYQLYNIIETLALWLGAYLFMLTSKLVGTDKVLYKKV